MIENFKTTDSYTGNGWSKYQMYVLKQLEDHNTLLQKIIEKNSDFFLAQNILQKETQNLTSNIEKITKILDELENKIESHEDKVVDLKKKKEIDEAVKSSTKALWGTVGAVVMGVFAVIYEVIKHAISFFTGN